MNALLPPLREMQDFSAIKCAQFPLGDGFRADGDIRLEGADRKGHVDASRSARNEHVDGSIGVNSDTDWLSAERLNLTGTQATLPDRFFRASVRKQPSITSVNTDFLSIFRTDPRGLLPFSARSGGGRSLPLTRSPPSLRVHPGNQSGCNLAVSKTNLFILA